MSGFYDNIVISDTSCFIAFTNIGRLNLLQSLCPSIITTPEVAAEYKNPLPSWVKITEVKDRGKITSIGLPEGVDPRY